MKSHTLYVIGNGFDLWHGIPSSLDRFKQYVQAADRDVYREIEEYRPTRQDWSNLELALADMDVDALIDNLGFFMGSYGAENWSDSGHHDFQSEVKNVVERLSNGLRQRFAEWGRKRLAALDTDALFFSFNYTATLGTLYGVRSEQILFIHGCVDLADDELVLGHAWHPQGRRSLNDRPDIEEIDTRLMEANDIIDGYFSATFNRSTELIAQHRGFFDALTEIEQVIVLGHSLSAVDAAYFMALTEQRSVAEAQWQVACRSPEEWPQKQVLLARLCINLSKATPMLWDSLKAP